MACAAQLGVSALQNVISSPADRLCNTRYDLRNTEHVQSNCVEVPTLMFVAIVMGMLHCV